MNTAAFVCLYGLFFVLVAGYLIREDDGRVAATRDIAAQRSLVLCWLAVGVLLRLPLLWDTGFHYDTGTYKAWALEASNPDNPLNLYREGYFADYPPFYMYVLGALGAVARVLDWGSSTHFTALIKVPALLCDAAASLLLLRHLRRELGEGRAWGLASLYWLNPALIFTGALWGQTEALLCLLIVGGWLAWRGGRIVPAAALFAIAVAFKPQGALYAGIFGIAVIIGRSPRTIATAALTGLVVYALIVARFAWSRPWDWLPNLYFDTASTYDFITVNAYNLWALMGWNWQKDVGVAFGLKMQTWALIDATGAIVAVAVWLGLRLRRTVDPAERGTLIAWAFALATIAFFMLAPRMHERYILMLLPMLLLVAPARIRLPLFVLWTCAALANIAYVYYYYIDLNTIAPHDTSFIRVSSAANVALSVLTVLWWQLPDWPQRALSRLPQLRFARSAAPVSPRPALSTWGLQHSAIVLGFVIAATAIGLYRVGVSDYPQTGVATAEGFTLEFEYEEPVVARYALVYAGEKAIGDNVVKMQLERYEGQDWVPLFAEREMPDFYRLYEVTLENVGPSTRYRWRASGEQWRINELGLLDASGTPLQPDALLARDSEAADYANLVDEPHTWIRGRGFLVSTYFDEIYHGRTGYEFLHRQPIYETTHPPLGKWFISWGIDVFGMTPFGWRFSGVIASALTVGVLAWGGWLFAGNLTAMLLVGGLGLFEFSRFTIGRYATIDSYLGLFTLLCVLFLWRQFGLRQHADWRDGWRLSPDLIAAGAALGAAIAVKWSALYGGVGAFMFFAIGAGSGFRRDGVQRWSRLWPRMTGAAVAFGAVPLLIYWFSYLPFLRSLQDAPSLLSLDGLREILKSQRDIFDYHAKLTSTHPFQSPFWTWPINLKPLWIFTGEGSPRTAISILGNPLIWWGGLGVMLVAIWQNLRRPRADELILFGAIASLYLPWALVDRAAFNYHYYPAALVLIVLLGKRLIEWSQWPRLKELPWIAVALAGGLFVWFYPTISGHPAPDQWFRSLRWLPTWWML
ncbi:phospholipid carrier-dependent glycosyltransferase [Sinimarinibacterium flocculans]|uniref:Polyprenol-phosphate-mannose--protein mannosyltransferase n=1 Tax=Sinimarinibacterium flocculans TaxID=985250 RepID=A0A318EJB8_9GAMM|nr:phospholipid carrier-dependent glycosyltransferase [Sinimarinibacterium flocculans]PXV70984.1 dolichyl-phosphate-mannose-protein mannosyltransferase [Sinimarinibacterium flocculans]